MTTPDRDEAAVRMALEYGGENTPALTREPVFVWTNAEAALDRILDRATKAEAEVERLRAEVEALGGVIGEQRHIAEFREDGWGLQHPVECRPNLLDCPLNIAIQEDVDYYGGPPPEGLGRFVAVLGDEGPEYAALHPKEEG